MSGKTGKEKALSGLLCWTLIPSVFVLDRILKAWTLLRLNEGEGFPLIPGILRVTRVNNAGAAFGLLKNASFFLTALSVISIAFIVLYLFKQLNGKEAPASACGWALVAGGALGNLYDRLYFGYVIDMIDLGVWPVFNAADSAICLGVGLILWRFFFERPRSV